LYFLFILPYNVKFPCHDGAQRHMRSFRLIFLPMAAEALRCRLDMSGILRPLAHPRLAAIRGCSQAAKFAPSPMKQAKQLAQREAFVAGRAAKRAAKKDARLAARQASDAAWDALPVDEREAIRTNAAAARGKRLAALAPAELPASASAPICVIDLGFGELMSDREIRSLAQQLLFCYSACKREAVADGAWPVRYHLSSFAAGSPLGAQLGAIQGSDSWPITRHATSYLEAFGRTRRAPTL
jgi:hypothetical protein